MARIKLYGYSSFCDVCFERVREYDFVHHKCSNISDHLEKLLEMIYLKINSSIFSSEDTTRSKISGVLLDYSIQFDHLSQEILLDSEAEQLYRNITSEMGWTFSKTSLWFKTKNPLLGGLSPDEMIQQGRFEKLKAFVETAFDENNREE